MFVRINPIRSRIGDKYVASRVLVNTTNIVKIIEYSPLEPMADRQDKRPCAARLTIGNDDYFLDATDHANVLDAIEKTEGIQ